MYTCGPIRLSCKRVWRRRTNRKSYCAKRSPNGAYVLKVLGHETTTLVAQCMTRSLIWLSGTRKIDPHDSTSGPNVRFFPCRHSCLLCNWLGHLSCLITWNQHLNEAWQLLLLLQHFFCKISANVTFIILQALEKISPKTCQIMHF